MSRPATGRPPGSVCDHAVDMSTSIDPPSFRSLRPSGRVLPVRRLTRAECDLVGFAGPLVLARRQVRWFGPWRTTGAYLVVRGAGEVVLACSRAELEALGVEPGAGDGRPSGWRGLVDRARHR